MEKGFIVRAYVRNPKKLCIEAHKRILSIMEEERITRLIDWATPSISFPQDKLFPLTLFPKILAGIFLPMAKSEMVRIAELIVISVLDWTIVRFIAPINDHAYNEIDVCFGDKPLSFKVARTSIAKFMIDELENNNYIHSMPIIGRKL